MPTVQGLLSTVLDSHKQQSEQARLILNFEFPMQKSSLSSGLQGHRNYPVQLQFDSTQANLVGLKFSIVYSSTCPASAALSRSANAELITENFKGKDWDLDQLNSWMQTSDSVAATPHAQRSLAEIELKVSDLEIGSFIDAFENCLGTPVQTAVKRMDELEFAKLNARNLMFCEDAIRKLADYCDKDQRIASYQITVNHQESLHAHNAVAKISKCK
jgi:GTP cyclohydrolase I